MAKENRLLAIDIGIDTLKMAEFLIGENKEAVLDKFAFAYMDTREREAVDVFAETYKHLLEENHFRAKRVRFSISGHSSFTRLCKLPMITGSGSGVGRVVAFEAKKAIPYAMEEVVWGYQLLRHSVTTTRTIDPVEPGEEPIVETDVSEEFEGLIVAAKNDQISAYAEVILSSGKKVLSVDVAPVALFNAARASQIREDESVLLLNIGGRNTSLVIADHNRVFVRNIPFGGDLITQQISKEFSMSFEEAEELKRRHGSIALGGAYEEPASEVEATISKIARNIMTRLHGEISRSINVWRAQHGGNAPERTLFSGGATMMRYMPEFFKEKLRIPVDYLNCFTVIGISASVDKEKLLDVAPTFPELTGMCLHDIVNLPVEISLVPEFIKRQEIFQRKKGYFYGSAVTLLLSLLVMLLSVNQRMDLDRKRVDSVKKKVEDTKTLVDRVKRAMGELNAAKGDFEATSAVLANRSRWLQLLEELQKAMPDTMFLVALEGLGDISSAVAAPSDSGGLGSLFSDVSPAADPSTTALPSAAPQKIVMNGANTERILEVKAIRLRGYTLVLKHDLLEDEFKKALKDNPNSMIQLGTDNDFLFEEFSPARGENNLTAFTIKLTLKQPIKK